jgi:hypothetical protein
METECHSAKQPPKINDKMKKSENELNRAFPEEEIQVIYKTHEEMFAILSHKGNANQNHIKILPHLC